MTRLELTVDLTRLTPIIYILRWQDYSEGSKKEKHVLKQDTIHCCYIQSLRKNISLSKMRCFVVQSSALGLKKKVCPFLPLENSRPLSPLREPQTPLSSSGTPDFLSAYLGIDSLTWIKTLPQPHQPRRRELSNPIPLAIQLHLSVGKALRSTGKIHSPRAQAL